MWCNLLFCLNNFYGSLPGLKKKKSFLLFVYWAIFRFINCFKGSPCFFILWTALTPEPFAPGSRGTVCCGSGEWFFSGEIVFRLEKLRWWGKRLSWWTITLSHPLFEKDTVTLLVTSCSGSRTNTRTPPRGSGLGLLLSGHLSPTPRGCHF